MIRRRKRRVRLIDVFDNPFATRDRRGVRRIRRNDGQFAKRPWSKRKGIRTRHNPVYDNPFATVDSRGVRRIHRNDGRYAKPTWSTRKGVRARKARKNPVYGNPFKDVLGRVHRNDGKFAKHPWSKGKAAKRVRAHKQASIPWEKRMIAARKRAMSARKRSRSNPFLDSKGRVHRNNGRFAKRPFNHPMDWMTTEHAPVKWLVRGNPRGFSDEFDKIFENPRGKKGKSKSKAKKGKSKSKAKKGKSKSKAKAKTTRRARKPQGLRVGGVKLSNRRQPKRLGKTDLAMLLAARHAREKASHSRERGIVAHPGHSHIAGGHSLSMMPKAREVSDYNAFRRGHPTDWMTLRNNPRRRRKTRRSR